MLCMLFFPLKRCDTVFIMFIPFQIPLINIIIPPTFLFFTSEEQHYPQCSGFVYTAVESKTQTGGVEKDRAACVVVYVNGEQTSV